MTTKVNDPYPSISDLDGTPLEGGYVYIGKPGFDPEAFPKAVFWDEDLTVAATQPVRTLAGRFINSGAQIGNLYLEGAYSILVKDENMATVFSADNFNVFTNVTGYDAAVFGAAGDGVTDDTAAIQQTIDTAAANGAGTIVDFGSLRYLISDTIRVPVGLTLRFASGNVELVTGVPTGMTGGFVWASDAPTDRAMVLWMSTNANETISYGSIEGTLMLDGNNRALQGFHCSSAAHAVFDHIVTYRTIDRGLLISDSNGNLCNRVTINRFQHFCGPNALAWNCFGFLINGDITGAFCTSISVDTMEIEYRDGNGCSFKAVDSCTINTLKTINRQGAGTGYSIAYLKSVNFPTFHAQKNIIQHAIAAGDIFVGDFCKNNVIGEGKWEYGSIVYESAGVNKRVLHVNSLSDFRTSETWATPKHKMIDQYPLAMVEGKGTVATNGALGGAAYGSGWEFPAAGTSSVSWVVRAPVDWINGKMSGVRLVMVSGSATSGNVRLQVSVTARSSGDMVGTASNVTAFTITPSTGTNVIDMFDQAFDTAAAIETGDLLIVQIERLGDDGLDTDPGTIFLACLDISYEFTGPASSGTYGPYAVPIRSDPANP